MQQVSPHGLGLVDQQHAVSVVVAGGKLRAEHRPLFHRFTLVVGQIQAAFLYDLVERRETVVPLFGNLHFVHSGTGKVGVKAVAGKVGADVLGRLDARHRRSRHRDRPAGKMHRRSHRAAQAHRAQGQRPGLPQTRFGNSK